MITALDIEREIERQTKPRLQPYLLGDWRGGIAREDRIYQDYEFAGDDPSPLTQYLYNEGNQTRHANGGLPYAITNSSISTITATQRIHALCTDLGTTGARFYAYMGTNLFRDTSLSDPALAVADTATNAGGPILVSYLNSTRYLWLCENDTSGGAGLIKVTADPTGSPPSWTTALGPANMATYAGGPLESIGWTWLYGKFNGSSVATFGALRFDAPLGTQPTVVPPATGLLNPRFTYDLEYKPGAGTIADDASIGTVTWSPTANAATINGTLISEVLDTNTSHYLKFTNWGFDLPAAAQIVAVQVGIAGRFDAGAGTSCNYSSVRIVDGSGNIVGANAASPAVAMPDSSAAGTGNMRFFGAVDSQGAASATTSLNSNMALWNTTWSVAMVEDADFGFVVSCTGTGSGSEAEIDGATMCIIYVEGDEIKSVTKSPSQGAMFAGGAGNIAWDRPQQVTADNGTNADTQHSSTTATANQDTTILAASRFGFGLPENAIVRGIIANIEHVESNSGANANDVSVYMLKNFSAVGSPTGSNLANGTSEWSTSAEDWYYGGPNNTFGQNWSALEINSDSTTLMLKAEQDTTNSIGVDHMQVTVFYQEPVTPAALVLSGGGHGIGSSPFQAGRVALLLPRLDVAVNSEPYYVDFALNSSDGLLTHRLSKVITGMANVYEMAWYKGGLLLTGGERAGIQYSRFIKHVAVEGTLRNLNAPTSVTTPAGVLDCRYGALFPVGDDFVVDVAFYTQAGSLTDRQWWMYLSDRGEFYADTLIQSKTDVAQPSAAPTPWAEKALNQHQNIIYSLSQNGANLHIARQFMPPDLRADPRTNYTTQIRSMGYSGNPGSRTETTALYTYGVEMALGSPLAEKAYYGSEFVSRRVSPNTGSYGRVTLGIARDGDKAFTKAQSKSFTSSVLTTDNEARKDGLIPQDYKTIMFRIGLEHEAGTATTPDSGLIELLTISRGYGQ